MNIQRFLVQVGITLVSIFVLNQLAAQGGMISQLIRGPQG